MTNIRRIDLNLLVALDVLLEEQNVTRAARRLALTQPTVSAMLARLRKLFDDPLFVRSQRGLVPTPRALAIQPGLKQWLGQAHGIVAGERFDPATAELTATVFANDYIQSALIVPFVEQLRRKAQHVRLALRCPQFADVTSMLANGELDLSIATTPDIPSLDLPSRLLYEESYICVVRKEHPLSGKEKVSLDEFCRFPHVVVSPGEGGFVGPTDRALVEVGRKRRVVLSVPGFLILPEILRTEDLIATVPTRVLQGRMTGLRTFAPPLTVPGFSVVMLWHQRLHNDAGHQWLRGLLADIASGLKAPQRR
jgi:DNA-binding transcriptional LysR family regulator